MDFLPILKRERRVSTAINVVLSAAFFLLVFGTRSREFSMAAPDNFALDFLAQAAAISVMAALVPALLVRKALRKGGAQSLPTTAAIIGQAGQMLLGGLVIAGLLAALCLLGPVASLSWTAALAIKLAFGGLLGFAVTHLTLKRLFASRPV